MKSFLIFLAIISTFLVLLSTVFELNQMSGYGMAPNLPNGSIMLVQKYSPNDIRIHSGQVVTYNRNNYLNTGRVIARPRQGVMVKDGNIYIRDEYSNELYLVKEKYLKTDSGTRTTSDGVWFNLENDEYLILLDVRDQIINLNDRVVKTNDIRGFLIKKIK